MLKKAVFLTILVVTFLLQQKTFADETFSTIEPAMPAVPYNTYQNQNNWDVQTSQNVNPNYYQYNNSYANRYETPYGYRSYSPMQSNQLGYGTYPQAYYNGIQNPVLRNVGTNILRSLFNH